MIVDVRAIENVAVGRDCRRDLDMAEAMIELVGSHEFLRDLESARSPEYVVAPGQGVGVVGPAVSSRRVAVLVLATVHVRDPRS